jgi:glutamate--cysteine ligase
MPAARLSLTVEDIDRFVGESVFTPASRGRVGIELEWLVVALDDATRPVAIERVRQATDAVSPLPGGSIVTFEPGGQVELSSPPLAGLRAGVTTIEADAAAFGRALADEGLGLCGLGLDAARPLRRVVDTPRYRAMEAYFDTGGPSGRTMMRGTAAVQVNVDLGPSADVEHRWQLAHRLGPVLAAAFANSPLAAGAPSGWRSTRLALWSTIDPGRTAPVDGGVDGGVDGAVSGAGDGRAAWARYALDARVMLIRVADDRFEPVLEPLTFREWMGQGNALGSPTLDDFAYHLTTLFPPVRPRGWLELRMIDALPDPWWRVAVAVTTALFEDDRAAAVADRATATTGELWEEATRHGLEHPALAAAARACFAAALDALPRLDSDDATTSAVAAFNDRYVARGRCPADDRLDEWTRDGTVMPAADRFVEATRT